MANIPGNPKNSWIATNTTKKYRNDNEAFYNSRAWRSLRAAYFRTHPLCAICKANNKTKAADHVDHKVPISRGGAGLDWKNLQSLCRSCHSSKTGSERRGNGCNTNEDKDSGQQ